jgi:hypothetical protein
MPYIPPENRPAIDARVEQVASAIASRLIERGESAEISVLYRAAFRDLAAAIVERESGRTPASATAVGQLAEAVIDAAHRYGQRGGWLGELNYALTRLIQRVPFDMVARGAWKEYLRYWLYAETVGALTRAAYEIHAEYPDTWIGNGLAGVFEDVKDEYKRRVNTAYEAVQILKSGDCFDLVPLHTRLVPAETDGVRGWTEVMLPVHTPEAVREG